MNVLFRIAMKGRLPGIERVLAIMQELEGVRATAAKEPNGRNVVHVDLKVDPETHKELITKSQALKHLRQELDATKLDIWNTDVTGQRSR